MMLVVGSEQLLGRQHLNSLSSSPELYSLNFGPLCLYTVIIIENTAEKITITIVVQLTGCPLGLTHSLLVKGVPANIC